MQREAEQNIKILLADDDKDDRFFFKLALKGLSFPTTLTTVNDGEQLMDYLNKNQDNLPDVIFLDLNMPIKDGSEALNEIEENPVFKSIPVVIYSTSYDDEVAGSLYEKGANFYIRKTDIENLRDILRRFFSKYSVSSFARPQKEEFAFSV
jgi:CheY-like chemotaxis protein